MSGIPAWAVRGAKVVYIGTGLPTQPGAELIPDLVIGRAYTINWTGWCGHQFCLGFVGASDAGAWDWRGFRPVITRTQEQDVAIFAPLLGHTVREDA